MSKILVKFLRNLSSLLLISLLFSLSSQAQDMAEIDSLKKVLEASPRDTNRIGILVDLWRRYAYNDPKEALKYAEQIISFSTEMNHKVGIATGHQRLGVAYFHLGDNKKARKEYFKALELYKLGNFINLQGIMLFNIGLGYKSEAQYDSTLFYLEEARKMFEIKGRASQKGAIHDGISGVYFEMGSYQLSIEHALKAVAIFEEAGDELRLADAQTKIGLALGEIKNYAEALKYFRESRIIYKRNNDLKFELTSIEYLTQTFSELGLRDSAIYYLNFGLEKAQEQGLKNEELRMLLGLSGEFIEQKEFEKARPLLLQVAEEGEDSNNINVLIPTYQNLGKYYYLFEKSKTKAEPYFLRAQKLAEDAGHLQHQTSIEKDLAILYKNWGKSAQALEHFFAHQSLKDSLLNLETASRIAELQTLYEAEKKDREIEQQKSEIRILHQEAEIDSLNRKLLFGGIILSLLLMAAIFFGYRQKIKRDQVIHEKEKAAYEQELLFNKKELAAHTLHLVQKSDLLEELKGQLESTRKVTGDSKQDLTQMIHLIKSDKHVEQDWQNFKTYFDKVHDSFDEKLQGLSEGLSQNEYRLAALMKMDLSTKEIATILNITSDSVHKGRYRLKKRLGMGADENLREFILSL